MPSKGLSGIDGEYMMPIPYTQAPCWLDNYYSESLPPDSLCLCNKLQLLKNEVLPADRLLLHTPWSNLKIPQAFTATFPNLALPLAKPMFFHTPLLRPRLTVSHRTRRGRDRLRVAGILC